MCLAIPGKIMTIDAKTSHAQVDYGDGTARTVNVSLVDVKVGDYVLVHAGFAIQVVERKEAEETIALFKEMLGAAGEA